MADDVSKKYALNIEVSVDSSSLNNLKNIQEPAIQHQVSHQPDPSDIFEQLYSNTPTRINNSGSQTTSLGDIKELSNKLTEISGKVDGIKQELEKRDTAKHSEYVSNASNLATSDIARSVAIQIMSAINDGISPILSSGMFGKSHMSAEEVSSAQTKTEKVDSSSLQKKIAATTGKKVIVQESQMPNGEYGEYEHSTQRITINSGKSAPVKKLALNHEATHTVQEAKGYTGNTQLFSANANTSEFDRNQSRYVNEYLTNTVAIIRTALSDGLDESSLRQAVEAYRNAIRKTSGVVIGNIEAFTDTIKKMSSLNISPETFMNNLAGDTLSLGNGRQTTLSIAANIAGYHTKSDGSIRNQNGKILTEKELLKLVDLDGRRINQTDIASHRMAHFISGSSRTLRGIGKFNGRKDFLRSAGEEFTNMGDFGVQFLPQERLAQINSRRQWQGLSYLDIQKGLRESTGYTHRGETLFTNEEAISSGSTLQTRLRKPGNVQFGLQSPLEKIMFAIGGREALDGVKRNTPSGYGFSKQDILDYIKSFIFEGTGTNEEQFQLASYKKNADGMTTTTKLGQNYGKVMDSIVNQLESLFESGDLNNPATFLGTNAMNTRLGDLAFYARVLKRGVKAGYIPDTVERVKLQQSEIKTNKDGDQVDTIENAEIGHLTSQQLGQAESIDIEEYERKRLAYERTKKAISSARRQIKTLSIGGSANSGLIGSDDSSQIMIGKHQISSLKDLEQFEKRVEEQFAGYQRENPEIAKKEAIDNMLTALRGIIGVIHGGEDTRKISTEQLEQEGRAVMAELEAIPDFIINEAKRRKSTIKLAGTDVGIEGVIKTKKAIEDYKKTMSNISSGGMFSTSRMEEEQGSFDVGGRIEELKSLMRKRRVRLAKENGLSVEEAGSRSIMSPILSRDVSYNDLKDELKSLEDYIKSIENTQEVKTAEERKAVERREKDLATPTQYERTVNGETVTRNVKFDKNEAAAMAAVYEKDYGAYNMAVGNLDALSTTTRVPLAILKKIRKNRSYMNFVGEDGNIQDFASPLAGSMSPEAVSRMRMLENPLKKILETSGNISGNAPKRIEATRSILADYLHRGETGAKHQLGSFDEFLDKFKYVLEKYGATDRTVNESSAKDLYDAIKDFNERSILSKSGLHNIDASVAKRDAEEVARKDILDSRNRMLRDDTKSSYDKEILEGNELLKKAGISLNNVSIDDKYRTHQYKLVSDESKAQGDIASGSSVTSKDDLNGAALYLHKMGRTMNPYSLEYKKGLSAAHYDLGDLSKYTQEEIAKMIRATQAQGLENTNADLIEVAYRNGGKKKKELTARNNDVFSSTREMSTTDAFSKGIRERYFVEHANNMTRGTIGSSGQIQTNDVIRAFSDNMRKIVERALNGGASSDTIKRIAEDVSAIKGILSNGNVVVNSTNTQKAGGMFETSKMAAEDSAIDHSIEAERQRRIEAARNAENEYSNLYEDETARTTQRIQTDDSSAQKRLEKSEFEAKLSELSSKREKLAFIDEKINSMNSEMDSMTNEDRLKTQTEINRLRKKRVAIENGPGTKEDKLEFNEWRDSLRSQQKEFISNLRGKGSEDISRAVSEEVKRLLNLEENRSVGNYDKKSEIQKLTTKLKEFEQSSRIKNDKNSLSDAINELKRKYKGEDNAFDATLKGAGVDDRPEKLRKEVERLNSVLDELKVKKEEALSSGDEASAKFYDTLIFQRQTRKDVVQGKQNAADKALRIANENAAARAIKEAERAQKQEQKRLDAMAAAHDKEGNQARSVFNKAVEYGAMSTLVYGFASEAKNAIDVMARFERQMVEVTKVMDPLYQSQELLTESAKRMAVQYGVSIIESAKGMAVFAQQGKNAAQIIQLTEASLLAANTTTLNAAQATEALTATIRQFNLTDSDAKRIIDSWLEVESRTAISAQTMADAIKISGTAARVAGLSFDEFNGILSAVGSATRETGSQLGTAFKFIISKMRTDDAVTALNRLGVATHNQNGDYRDLMVVLSDLNSKWVEMSQEQKASTAIAIAGTRRYNTLMTLMEKWDDALEAVSMSEDSHGKAMRMNAAVMDTYEKKVQKARASVEAFYASMSKGTTKGFLGGIQESISIFAGIGEKTPLASGLAQAGIVASGISFFSRMGGSMGLGTALGDLKANSEIKSEISKAIASEVKSSIGDGKALFRSHSSRKAALDRLDMIDSGKNVSSKINKESKFLDGRDVLAEKIATRIAGVNKESEIYQSTLKRVQNEISRTIASHKNYIEKLENHTSKVGRFGVAAGEFAKKHATVIAAIGIGLQTLANSEFFKDEKSLTGKTTAGEVIDLAGSLGTAIGAGAAASQFGGPWAGVAVGALSMLGPLVSNLQSWGEKITGSTRLTLLRLQEESDRLKTLTTSIDSYSRLREKERSGQALTLEEQEQKRVLEQNISLASPTAIKIGHRGVGSSIDEGEFEKLVGRKTEFKDKYASISDQMAYEQMFSQTFGGKTISDDLRKNLFTEQKALDVQLSKLRDFDAEHTGELSESEHSDRMKIIEEIKKIQERISKGNTAINEVEQAFFAAVRNRESGVLNATRRGESYEANDGPNDRIRKMFEQIVTNRNGNISEARKVTSEAILSGIISRGTIKNRTTAIEHAQRTGMLYSATRGRELEGGKQEIILHTRAADGSIRKSESIVMDKKGSDDDYIREVATRKGLDARSIAYTSELSDTLFRYSLKEVEKFSELTRKIGDTIYNSYKAEVDRINSIEGISSKFRIGGVDSQYRGSDIRLEEALRATSMRAKSAGSVDSELIKKMAEYAKNSNPSKAMFAGAEISSQIARHNTLAGATEHLVMSMSTQVQKANMANQIIEAIYRASFKTERGRDGEVADIGGEEKKRINEYLAMAGLGFDEFDKIRHSLGSEATEEDFKRALMSRVSAAADIMAKRDADDISKYFKMLEDNVERLANIMKQTAEAMEIKRKDSFAANLDYSGMVFDRDIVNSYKGMSAHASMYDDEITKLSAVIEASRSGVDIQKNAVDQALKTRDEAIAKYGRDSQQAITANDNYLRLRNNYDQALSSLNISLEKLDNLKGLQQQLKAMATGSFGEHKAFMRTVESSAIGESTRNGNISFGVGSSDYNNISLLAEQNRVLSDRRMDIQSQYDAYAQMAKDGKLTEAQKTEMKSLELQLGEIDKAIRENGMKLDTANMNLEKTYAEARRNTRRLQLENLANALSGSKDTGRSQKAMFDDNYNRMRGLWRDYVSAMKQNPNAVSEDQKQYMKELAKKMENLRDVGDLMGNPAFNKNYLLASAQDQAIADNIVQRLQSGETMRQIFSDAGMKEMGRNNPLISQLMDNMMQKQENQRLADVSNQMLDVETEMLGYLKNIAGLMNDPMFRTKIEEGGKSNRDAKKGFANGTTFTGSGGKFESAGLVEVHKGEGLGVLSQTAMARYPMMSRKILKMISDMNLGTYPGFANGTRVAGDVFNYGGRRDILGLDYNTPVKAYVPTDALRELARIMRVDTDNMWMPAGGHSASRKIGGFNQGGRIFMNEGAPYSTAVHEVMHGANGSQFGAYNTSREAMSVFGEMAIGGTKNPGYGNFFTQQAYSGLKLGSNPAKNAQAIFDMLAKNGNYKYQWEGINNGLRSLDSRYVLSELGTVAGNRDFKHGYAQAASVIAEYGRNTGTSSQKDIDRMYRSLEKLFKRATGSATIDFAGHSGENFNVKEFASACADFRASVDKNSKASSNDEILATVERRARYHRDKKQEVRDSKTEFKERLREIKDKNYGNINNTGITVRGGKYRNYGVIEKLIQSDTVSFLRAGGLKYAGGVALDYMGRKASSFGNAIKDKYSSWIASPTKRAHNYFVDNYTNRGLQRRIDSAMMNDDYIEARRLNNKRLALPYNKLMNSRFITSTRRNAQAFADFTGRIYNTASDWTSRGYNATINLGKDFGRGTADLYKHIASEMTPDALMNRRARVLLQGKISGVPGFSPKLTRFQRFRAEAYRQAANFISSPSDYLMSPIRKIGDMRIPFTTSLAMNSASRKAGLIASPELVNKNTAKSMTLRDVVENIRARRAESRRNREERIQERTLEKEWIAAQGVKEIAVSRFNSARRGRGLRSWFIDNFTEAGLERRQTILKNRVLESKRARTKAVIGINDTNNRYIEASHGVSSENIDNILSDSKKYTTAKVNAEERFQRDVFNARKYLPSINRRLATVRGIKRAVGFVNDRAIKPVTSGINKFTSGGAMKLKMLESAYQGGMETFNNIKEGEYWKASESGLRTIGSLHYAGALEKIPGGGKLSKVAPVAYYLSGGLELARGIKDGDAGTIVSGAGNIANSALFSRPMQNILGKQVERSFGPGSVARFGKGMGWGMAVDLVGTGIEKLGDHYNKPWLKRTGQVVGGTGEAVSDVALTASTMGLNKVVSGAIDAGRFLFDDEYREDYGNRRANVGGGFIALEQISKLVPGANGAYRALGFDVPGMLDDINSNYANVNALRERDEALHRNRSNVMGALLRNDNLKYGANANREDKMAATAAAFATINEASKGTLAKGPDAIQAAMEAYFRNEDASQMMARYDVSGKKNASVRAQGEILKLHARLAELDKKDQSLSSNLFGVSWGGNARQKERNEINERIAELEKEGSFDRGKQVENTRQAAQDHFDKLFGRKANVFGKGGILEGLRKKRRDLEVKIEEDALSKNQDALVKARNDVFNDDKLTYSYASLADMEHAAKMGNEKAQAELAKFNERASKDERVTDASGKIAASKNRIADLKGKKIDGSGEITEQDFDDLRRFESSNIEIQTNNKNKEIDRLKSQENKLKEDISLMEKEGSSAEAIKKKQAELQGVKAQIGKVAGERDQLLISKRISDKLVSGKLADPRKLAAEAAEMEEKRNTARAIYDDPNKIRELNAGKTVTVKIGGKEVTLNKKQVQAWKGISDEAIAKKRKEHQSAQEALSEAVSEETIRQDLAKKYGGDVSKVTPEMIEARKKEIKENQRKEVEKRENERQDRIYSGTVFGKREAAQKAYDDSVKRRDSNRARIAELEKKQKSEQLSDKEKEELREAKNMQTYYDRAVDRREGDLNRANRSIVERQRAARKGLGGDARLMRLSKEDYEKERANNEKRIKELEGKQEADTKRKAELEAKQKNGKKLTKEEQTELDRINSDKKELSRRKNMTRTMFAETDLRKFKRDKSRLEELRQKKADGKTLTADEQKELDTLGKQDFGKEAEQKLVNRVDEEYKNKNGGMSFGQLEEEAKKERRKITLDNLGLKSIKYNKETGRYEAEDDKQAPKATVDERTDALSGEDSKATADTYTSSTPRTAGVTGTSQTTQVDDKNVADISKDTATMSETMAQILERLAEIMKLIPSGGESESSGQKSNNKDVVPEGNLD